MKILTWPNNILRKKSSPVGDEYKTREFQSIIDQMFQLMYEQSGVGLSAVQVGMPIRMFIADIGSQMVFINPVIEEYSGGQYLVEEGCLSLPGYYDAVERYKHVEVSYLDRDGNPCKINTENMDAQLSWRDSINPDPRKEKGRLLAQIIQHETDHFEGVLKLVDIVDKAKQAEIKKIIGGR